MREIIKLFVIHRKFNGKTTEQQMENGFLLLQVIKCSRRAKKKNSSFIKFKHIPVCVCVCVCEAAKKNEFNIVCTREKNRNYSN